MEAKKFPFDIRCSRRPQQPLHQPRRRQRFPLDVSAKATPPQPPIVRGAGGGGTSPSDDEDGEEEEEEAERERRRRSGAGSSSSSSPSSSSSSSSSPLPPKSRNDTMSLQARVAADVLGVVHPARRNLTFSRALDVRFWDWFFLFVRRKKEERKKRVRGKKNSPLSTSKF
jgi:hypothetical protein